MQLKRVILLLTTSACILVWGEALDGIDPLSVNRQSLKGASVYFIQPQDGQVFETGEPIVVQFGLRGMGVAPAGVATPGTGHHHLLINQKTLPDLSKPIPAGKDIIHFGGGQTETQLTLAPGKHKLQMVLGNQYHLPHIPPLISDHVTIVVY
ncbi:MAG: hypothetical protein CBC09_01385 [Cellvibrionales bacterium TMED49]|nr:rod shape-determining protein RodA [Porticoccaceae bacterium]OUU39846.1 MAG: hypothetical protein CBC09_01385 [Cellvibrionales bacterium TMED49]